MPPTNICQFLLDLLYWLTQFQLKVFKNLVLGTSAGGPVVENLFARQGPRFGPVAQGTKAPLATTRGSTGCNKKIPPATAKT